MGAPNFGDEFKRDTVPPLPGSRNVVSMRGRSRIVGIPFVRFRSDRASALTRSTNG